MNKANKIILAIAAVLLLVLTWTLIRGYQAQKLLASQNQELQEQLELLLRFQWSGCVALIRGSFGIGEADWARDRETVDRFLRKGLEIPMKTTLL